MFVCVCVLNPCVIISQFERVCVSVCANRHSSVFFCMCMSMLFVCAVYLFVGVFRNVRICVCVCVCVCVCEVNGDSKYVIVTGY